MIYWGPRYERFENVFLKFGTVVDVRHLHDKVVGRGDQPELFDPQRAETVVEERPSP
jgi:hypothetical protein